MTPYLGSVENDRKTAGKIIDIIMEEYHCQGAALIDDMKFLARSGAFSSIVLTENNYPRLLSATKTFKGDEDQPRAFTGGRILSSL